MKILFSFLVISCPFLNAMEETQPPKHLIPELIAHLPGSCMENAASFTPNGRKLVTAGLQRFLQIWDTSDYSKPQLQITTPIGGAQACATRPDSAQAAIGYLQGKVDIFDISSGAVVTTLQGNDSVEAIQYADQENLLSAVYDGTCKLWDVKNNKIAKTFKTQAGAVWDVHINPADPNQFAAVSSPTKLTIWDMRQEADPLISLDEVVNVYRVTHNNNGDILIGADYQNILRDSKAQLLAMYTVHGKKMPANTIVPAKIGQVPLGTSASRFMIDNDKVFISGLDNGQIVITDTQDSAKSFHFNIHSKEANSVQSLDIHPDGQTFVVGYTDGGATVFDCTALNELVEKVKEAMPQVRRKKYEIGSVEVVNAVLNGNCDLL